MRYRHSHDARYLVRELCLQLLWSIIVRLFHDIRAKPLLQLIDADIRHLSMLSVVRREDDLVHDMDHAVASNGVVELDASEAVDVDDTEPKNRGNVNTDGRTGQECIQAIVVLVPLDGGRVGPLVVKGIAVHCRVGSNGVLENGVEILGALFGVEEKGVGSGTQALEGIVARREKGAACNVLAVDKLDKVSLFVR